MGRVKRIWYLSPMRAAKVQASLRICVVSPEPTLLTHTSSESRGTIRQKARSLAPLNGWACAVKVCHDRMLEDTNSLDGAHIINQLKYLKLGVMPILKYLQAYQNGETEEDPDQFLHALNSSVEIFVNRMRSNSQRGRSIATDSSVQSLFNVISNMHPQLMKYIQGQEDLRGTVKVLKIQINWATSWQNQQNGMCTQQRLRSAGSVIDVILLKFEQYGFTNQGWLALSMCTEGAEWMANSDDPDQTAPSTLFTQTCLSKT